MLNMLDKIFFNGAWAAFVCGSISLISLIGALTSQYAFGMEPCTLCIYQRFPHLIVVIFSLLAIFLWKNFPKFSTSLVFFTGISFLTGFAIAFFHTGVEQHWWSGMEACTMTVDYTASIEEIQKQLASAPVVRCDEIPWSLFGISMAGYNALLSLGMGLFAILASVLTVRRINGY